MTCNRRERFVQLSIRVNEIAPRKLNTIFRGCVLLSLFSFLLFGDSVNVTIDWSNPKPSPSGAPTQITNETTLEVTVTHVNNILYQYTVNTSVTTAPTNDLAYLLSVLNPTKVAGGGRIPVKISRIALPTSRTASRMPRI